MNRIALFCEMISSFIFIRFQPFWAFRTKSTGSKTIRSLIQFYDLCVLIHFLTPFHFKGIVSIFLVLALCTSIFQPSSFIFFWSLSHLNMRYNRCACLNLVLCDVPHRSVYTASSAPLQLIILTFATYRYACDCAQLFYTNVVQSIII